MNAVLFEDDRRINRFLVCVGRQGDYLSRPGLLRGLPIPDHKYQVIIMLAHLAGSNKKQTRKQVTRKHQQLDVESLHTSIGGITVEQETNHKS